MKEKKKNNVYKRGNNWYYKFNVQKIAFQRDGYKTKSEAQIECDKAFSWVTSNLNIGESIEDIKVEYDKRFSKRRNNNKEKSFVPTFSQVCEEFFSVENVDNTLATYKKKVKSFKEKYGDKMIKDISYSEIQSFINQYENHRESYVEGIICSIKAVFRYAKKEGYISDNIVENVKIPKKCGKKIEKKAIEIEEFNELLKLIEARNYKDECVKQSHVIGLKIGYYMGLRLCETFAITKENVDLENKNLKIKQELVYDNLINEKPYIVNYTKTKAEGDILPIPDVIFDDLKYWLESTHSEYLLCDCKGSFINPKRLQEIFSEYKKNNKSRVTYHELRHSFVTNLYKNGTDIKTIQLLARHNNFSTTMNVYAHIDSEEHLRQAINMRS